MIHVENLSKSFGNVHAVRGISFDVHKGEVVGLLGPNGAGKTTTMRVITGFLLPDSGVVQVDGASVVDDCLLTKGKIGYLPESAPLYGDMEVTSYLSYIADLRGIAASEKAVKIKNVVVTCGLSEVVGRPIAQLSKGYNQRVGLAQALIHEPPILILDEPTSGLDPNQIVEIRKLIKEIGKERTVILSTHILQEVQATCNRALIISNGELVGQGTLEELMSKGKGGLKYYVSVKAQRREIEEKLGFIHGVSFHEWMSDEHGDWQKLILGGTGDDDHSENIFDWAVSNNWKLNELRCEKASLEQVFYELTRNNNQ